MLDIILANYMLPKGDTNRPSTAEETVAGIIILLVVLCAAIGALVVAVRRKQHTDSYSADLIMATFSPIMYWVLYAFKGVSHKSVTDSISDGFTEHAVGDAHISLGEED